MGKSKVKGKEVAKIKLSPQERGKPYHTILLSIYTATNQINSITILSKDGNTFIYDLKLIKNEMNIPNKTFQFDTSGVDDIVDLRE